MMKGVSGLFSEVSGSTKNRTYKTYGDKRKLIICKDKVRLPYVRSAAQGTQRDKFKEGKDYWNELTDEEKEQYKEEAKEHKLTGYQYFMGKWLRGEIILYTYYKVTINNTNNSNNLTDYTILLTISNDSQFFTDCENNKNYIRAYDTDKETPLKYWIEQWDTTGKNARIWIKIPSIPANSTKYIYIRIDKELTESGEDPENTFLFFDDASSDRRSDYEIKGIHAGNPSVTFSYDSNNKEYLTALNERGWSSCLIKNLTIQDCEMIIKRKASSVSNANFGTLLRYQYADDKGYALRGKTYETPDRINILYFSGTSELTVADDSIGASYNTNTYYTIIARAYGNNLFIDCGLNNKTLSATDSNITNAGMCGILIAYDAGYYYFNYVRVRKYQPPEPTISYTKE